MARSRSFIVVLTGAIASASCCALFAQDPPKAPESAPKFDLPPGGADKTRSGSPPPKQEGEDRRWDWRGRGDRRGPGGPGEQSKPQFQLPPEAQAMREQAKKEFEKMTPEQRQKFWGNFKNWIDMPTEQRERFSKMHEDRFQKAREEIREVIKKSGLTLDDEQQKKFAQRYYEERRSIEEQLRKELDERRKPMLAAMEEKLKAEFSKPAEVAQPQPAEQK